MINVNHFSFDMDKSLNRIINQFFIGNSRDNGIRATLIMSEIRNIGSEVRYKIESFFFECKLFL